MRQILKYQRLWLVLAIAALIIAAHGVALYYVSSHLAASTAVLGGVFALVIFKHLGLLAPFLAILRKWRNRR
jgi:hypothetical protein